MRRWSKAATRTARVYGPFWRNQIDHISSISHTLSLAVGHLFMQPCSVRALLQKQTQSQAAQRRWRARLSLKASMGLSARRRRAQVRVTAAAQERDGGQTRTGQRLGSS